MKAILIDIAIAILIDTLTSTQITFDPPSIRTRILMLGILIDSAGLHLEILEWQP